jgi:hypothetical protein
MTRLRHCPGFACERQIARARERQALGHNSKAVHHLQTGRCDEPRKTRSTRNEGWNRLFEAVADFTRRVNQRDLAMPYHFVSLVCFVVSTAFFRTMPARNTPACPAVVPLCGMKVEAPCRRWMIGKRNGARGKCGKRKVEMCNQSSCPQISGRHWLPSCNRISGNVGGK